MPGETPKEKAFQVHEKLNRFFGEAEWRIPLSPVAELVSTILSQNTNDRNRDAAFDSLTRRFPDWEDVVAADTGELIDSIRTAGLANQKGPRIQNVLREIKEERGSLNLDFLADLEPEEARRWLMHFKGVGPKTAAIVLLFAMNIPAFPVDTHIYRVTARLGLTPKSMTAEQAHDHLAGLFDPVNYKTDHLNVIRLGREICRARNPRCAECPLRDMCDYFLDMKQPLS